MDVYGKQNGLEHSEASDRKDILVFTCYLFAVSLVLVFSIVINSPKLTVSFPYKLMKVFYCDDQSFPDYPTSLLNLITTTLTVISAIFAAVIAYVQSHDDIIYEIRLRQFDPTICVYIPTIISILSVLFAYISFGKYWISLLFGFTLIQFITFIYLARIVYNLLKTIFLDQVHRTAANKFEDHLKKINEEHNTNGSKLCFSLVRSQYSKYMEDGIVYQNLCNFQNHSSHNSSMQNLISTLVKAFSRSIGTISNMYVSNKKSAFYLALLEGMTIELFFRDVWRKQVDQPLDFAPQIIFKALLDMSITSEETSLRCAYLSGFLIMLIADKNDEFFIKCYPVKNDKEHLIKTNFSRCIDAIGDEKLKESISLLSYLWYIYPVKETAIAAELKSYLGKRPTTSPPYNFPESLEEIFDAQEKERFCKSIDVNIDTIQD